MTNKVIIFTVGVAAGSVATWLLLKEKYKQLADEEIESVREHYRKKDEDIYEVKKDYAKKLESLTVDTSVETAEYTNGYNQVVADLGYVSPEKDEEEIVYEDEVVYIEPGVDYIKPYVIRPDEYGERDDLDTKCYTYYADFVLTDEEGEIVADPENIVGDALLHFGRYEEDSVCVRNENTECDYEILKHEKTFSEVNGGPMNVDAI